MAKINETSNNPLLKKTQPDFAAWAQHVLKTTQDSDSSKPLPPTLFVVATPIGNLGDISLRALWVLSAVDVIFCEDTRRTGQLLHLYGIKKPLVSCHDHNEDARIKDLLAYLAQGRSAAYVSDAGTPLVSDPGFRLVRACRQAGHAVTAIPGASALLTALACAGLPSDRFLFVGFLPPKAKARQEALEGILSQSATLLLYETAQRLVSLLEAAASILGATRQAVLARELTKLYEEVQTGALGALINHVSASDQELKGEFVLLIEGCGDAAPPEAQDVEAALREALKTLSVKDAAATVSAALGLKKKDVYHAALLLTEKTGQKD